MTDIRVFIGKTRAYLLAVSAKGLEWLRDTFDLVTNNSVDFDLEHLPDVEEEMVRGELNVDTRGHH